MGEDSEEQKKKKALLLMADYIDQRDALLEGPAFHTPPFVEKRIEGSRTIFYAPVEDVRPQGPVSFRKPFMKPDAVMPPKKVMPAPMDRRPSAKELIAKLRVVKEGVETRKEMIERMSRTEEATAEQEAADAQPGEQAAGPTPVEEEDEKGVPEELPEVKPSEGPMTDEGIKAIAERSEGGKLCPACGAAIGDSNKLYVCTDCGKKTCGRCGGYDLSHMKSDVFYEYKFDWPLCITCYDKAYQIQKNIGKAIICYGNGNYSYALYYANAALQLDPESKYASKAQGIIKRVNDTKEQTAERDKEWRIARKHFMRQPVEDPRWR